MMKFVWSTDNKKHIFLCMRALFMFLFVSFICLILCSYVYFAFGSISLSISLSSCLPLT